MRAAMQQLEQLRNQNTHDFFKSLRICLEQCCASQTATTLQDINLILTFTLNSLRARSLAAELHSSVFWESFSSDDKIAWISALFNLLQLNQTLAMAAQLIAIMFNIELKTNPASSLPAQIISGLCPLQDAAPAANCRAFITCLGFITEDCKASLLTPFSSSIISYIDLVSKYCDTDPELASITSLTLERSIKFVVTILDQSNDLQTLNSIILRFINPAFDQDTIINAFRAYDACMTYGYEKSGAFFESFGNAYMSVISQECSPEIKAAAMRVWDSIASIEFVLRNDPSKNSFHYIDTHSEMLIGEIAKGLVSIDETFSSDDQTFVFTYYSTLSNIAKSLDQQKAETVFHYANTLFENSSWVQKFAATKFYTSIAPMITMDEQTIKNIIVGMFSLISDSSMPPIIRVSASETLSVVITTFEPTVNPELVDPIIKYITTNIGYFSGEIVINLIDIIIDICRLYTDNPYVDSNDPNSLISKNFSSAIHAITSTVYLENAFRDNIISPCFDCIYRLIYAAPDHLFQFIVEDISTFMINEINEALSLSTQGDDTMKYDLILSGYISSFCAMLTRFPNYPIKNVQTIKDIILYIVANRNSSDIAADLFDCASALITFDLPDLSNFLNQLYTHSQGYLEQPNSPTILASLLGTYSTANYLDIGIREINVKILTTLSNLLSKSPDMTLYGASIISYLTSFITRRPTSRDITNYVTSAKIVENVIQNSPDVNDLEKIEYTKEIYDAALNFYCDEIVSVASNNIAMTVNSDIIVELVYKVAESPMLKSSIYKSAINLMAIYMHANRDIIVVFKTCNAIMTMVQHVNNLIENRQIDPTGMHIDIVLQKFKN